jgi:hypothetical protein
MSVPLGEISWERMIQAVENVRNRLMRATHLLAEASIPYAVVGGNAVAAWVSKVDTAAVRNTQDVDILIQRSDLEQMISAMEAGGFVYWHSRGIHMFLDGPGAKFRDAVHVLFAGDKVREEYVLPTPQVTESDRTIGPFCVLNLEPLVRMKLTSFRDKDRMHLRDFIDIGLVDSTWPAKFPSELGSRLQLLLDDPDG